jgi:hypothetical protein
MWAFGRTGRGAPGGDREGLCPWGAAWGSWHAELRAGALDAKISHPVRGSGVAERNGCRAREVLARERAGCLASASARRRLQRRIPVGVMTVRYHSYGRRLGTPLSQWARPGPGRTSVRLIPLSTAGLAGASGITIPCPGAWIMKPPLPSCGREREDRLGEQCLTLPGVRVEVSSNDQRWRAAVEGTLPGHSCHRTLCEDRSTVRLLTTRKRLDIHRLRRGRAERVPRQSAVRKKIFIPAARHLSAARMAQP